MRGLCLARELICWPLRVESRVSGVSEKGRNVVGGICLPAHQAHGIYSPRTDLQADAPRKACCLFVGKSKL